MTLQLELSWYKANLMATVQHMLESKQPGPRRNTSDREAETKEFLLERVEKMFRKEIFPETTSERDYPSNEAINLFGKVWLKIAMPERSHYDGSDLVQVIDGVTLRTIRESESIEAGAVETRTIQIPGKKGMLRVELVFLVLLG